eukprot:gnl/Hemi2/13548_TR4628_c0_g1_i3.p1 gnl/Hemi2/13548_TR4628_c0_g1~~gnl/Hemi2/13548_TR4628_c0_g1_i3.p1  ORF type:complete len:223 (-),score=19.71 gnl/Hemi2/13548_TR4628_c0_g1_i3:221-889(-)
MKPPLMPPPAGLTALATALQELFKTTPQPLTVRTFNYLKYLPLSRKVSELVVYRHCRFAFLNPLTGEKDLAGPGKTFWQKQAVAHTVDFQKLGLQPEDVILQGVPLHVRDAHRVVDRQMRQKFLPVVPCPVTRALAYLPKDLHLARERRIDRALHLAKKRKLLARENWEPIGDPYLLPFLEKVDAQERDSFNLSNGVFSALCPGGLGQRPFRVARGGGAAPG